MSAFFLDLPVHILHAILTECSLPRSNVHALFCTCKAMQNVRKIMITSKDFAQYGGALKQSFCHADLKPRVSTFWMGLGTEASPSKLVHMEDIQGVVENMFWMALSVISIEEEVCLTVVQ